MSEEEELCKHRTYKKIIPGHKGSIILCGECNQELDKFRGGLFENWVSESKLSVPSVVSGGWLKWWTVRRWRKYVIGAYIQKCIEKRKFLSNYEHRRKKRI